MVTHTIHPDSHEFGLADGCERCDQHAESPLQSLDDDNLLAIYDRVARKLDARSGNERAAMNVVEGALRLHRLLALYHMALP